jgi:outer membrane protein
MKLLLALTAIIALGCASSAADAAELKVATVNLKKAFDDYWKTKQADKQLKDEAATHEKRYKEMMEDIKKTDEEYRKLAESTNDTAIAETEREKRKKAAVDKLRQLQDMDGALKAWMRSTGDGITEKKRNLREKILGEIKSYIEARARAGNFTLVLDSSAESVNNAPMLLYVVGITDLTDELLKQLNATAPVITPDPPKTTELTPKNGEKKHDKK